MSFTLTEVEAREVTLRRYAAQTIVGYRPVRGVRTDTVIVASVQQPTPSDMRILPDGFDARDVAVYIADDEIQHGDNEAGLPPDEIDDAGTIYQVQRSAKADALGPIPDSWRAVAVRLQALQAPEGA